MKMVFFPKKLHRASSLRRWYLILQFLLDKRSIFDADSTQMQMQLQMMQLNLIRDFLLFFNQWWWEDLKQRRWWQEERSNTVAQFIAVLLTASFLKQDNNQDVLRWWDGGGLGGPVEHGGGRLGLTLVSRQQEGGSLSGVSMTSWHHHFIMRKILILNVFLQFQVLDKTLSRAF